MPEKNNVKLMSELLKAPKATPIQEVKPVKEKVTDNDMPLNVRINKDLLKRVKAHAFHNEKSLKDITTEALEAYLKEG